MNGYFAVANVANVELFVGHLDDESGRCAAQGDIKVFFLFFTTLEVDIELHLLAHLLLFEVSQLLHAHRVAVWADHGKLGSLEGVRSVLVGVFMLHGVRVLHLSHLCCVG